MPLYLGLDSSTQSISAVVIEASDSRREVVFESSINFDETFPRYGTRHGVLPRADPAVAVSSPSVAVTEDPATPVPQIRIGLRRWSTMPSPNIGAGRSWSSRGTLVPVFADQSRRGTDGTTTLWRQ